MHLPSITLVLAVLLSACTSTPEYSQAEIATIETREVNAGAEATFDAAAGALLDAGYTITMSDRAGGMLTARLDTQAHPVSNSTALPYRGFTIAMHVQPRGTGLTSVRIKIAYNNKQVVSKEMIDGIWLLLQGQVMMKSPASMRGK